MQYRIVHGNVTSGGRPVDGGEVRFFPINHTKGPITVAIIASGQYKANAHGGVPLGAHRVEVNAWRLTGRKVAGMGRFEEELKDEHQPCGPAAYAGEASPLRLELSDSSPDTFDIDLPST